MLKKFIQTALLLVVLCTTATTYAQIGQSPEGIQFQALATDANGHPAAGRVIYVKDAIVAKTATGTIVYSETFKVTASSAGIFTIVLGKGTYASGVTSIANIDWANGPFFLNLKIAVEPTVPTASWNVNNEYVDLGTSQFWSVPYALYAGNVKGADGKLNTSDTAAMLKPYFTSINLKANIESPTFTGTVSGITKAMVGLGNVDNTADINKPISTATQTALDVKANATDVTTALALKANAADVNTALDLKVDKVTGKALSTNDYTTAEKTKLAAITGTNTGDQDLSALAVAADVNSALALKANTSDVNAALALKANAANVANSLALKANTSDVNTALALKANTADVNNALIAKADVVAVNNAVAALNASLVNKADNAVVTNQLVTKEDKLNKSLNVTLDAASDTKYPSVKAVKTYVDAQVAGATIADASATEKGKIQLAGDLAGTAAAPTVPGLALKAPIASPTFTGIPTAPTAVAGTNTNQLATTEFVTNANATNANLTGDVTSVGNTATVVKINGTSLAGLSTGILKNTTSTGVPTIAVAGTDYQAPLTLTTTGTGAATLSGTTLNIPIVTAVSSTDASTLSGTVAIIKGGTGATSASGALTNLGAAPIASPTFTGTVSAPIYASTPQLLTAGAIINWNPATGLNASVTLNQNSTLRFTTTPAVGSYGTLVLTQDATGGRTITLPSTTNKVLGSTSSTTIDLSTAANAIDIVNFYYDGTNYYWNIGQGYGAASSASSTGVPYTGATGRVDLGAYNLTVNGLTVGKGVNSIGSNVAVGVSALGGTGNFNTAFGNNVLASSSQTGIYNNAFGFYSLNMNTTGRDNTAMGTTALYRNTTGESNSAFGNQALGNSVTGSNNTALGYQPLYLNTTGSDNTATGYHALKGNTIGSFNTAVGKFALNANVDGNYNTAIGNSADVASATLTNATAIGNGAIVSASNSIQLGNSAVTNVKTSGTLTAGAVTYPKVHGTANQVLATTGSGTLTWTSITSGGGDASTLTGVVSVANGGTGTTTLTGLVKGNGTGAMTAAVAGTDYLAPNGSAASLTNFPTFNQNTTGNAATATLATNATTAGNITATSNTTLTSLANLTTVGTITSGTWSGTAIAVANGGTGATNAADARTNLGLVIGTNVQAPLVAGTDYLAPNGSAASLTNFPTFNQNTTGNAATATLAGNITATSNSTLTSLANLTTVGTLTSGTWSGTAIAVAKGGTGATTLTVNNVLLGNGTNALQTVAPGASGNVLTSDGTTWTSSAPSGGSGSGGHTVGEVYGGGIVFYVTAGGYHGLIVDTYIYETTPEYMYSDVKNPSKHNTDKSGNLYTDWYIPTYQELILLYTARSNSDIATLTNISPNVFMSSDYMKWTQASPYRCLNFSNGSVEWINGDWTRKVIAIRSF